MDSAAKANRRPMIARHLTPALRRAATRSPVVLLSGARQTGKTTLVRAVFPDHRYLSLETPDVREAATGDPRSFLAQADRLILDEVQRAPALLSYIQGLVDDDGTPGRFVLTGSQNMLLMESVSQTLAGRVARLRLDPFSLAEIRGRPPFDPDLLDAPATEAPASAPPEFGLWETLFRGFYPPLHDRGEEEREWFADYTRSYVDRDLREVMTVSDPIAFLAFFRLAAGRTAAVLNLSGLADDTGITQQTARRWLAALEIGFLATTLRPHHKNYRKRFRKRPRLHFLDSGLLCYLLGIRDAETLAAHPLRGAVFESFVASELVKAFSARREEPPLYFFRDSTGHEVDFLVDLGSRVVPVEVKSGATFSTGAVRGLERWTSLPGNPNEGGALVTGGDRSFDFEGCRVRPWFLS